MTFDTTSPASSVVVDAPSAPATSRALGQAGRLALVAIALLLGGAGVRTYFNTVQAKAVADSTHDNAVWHVLTTRARPGQGQRSVNLPATLKGLNEADIHARTNGYVRAWKKDIGDRVRQGEVLVLIDTPEVDQDLAQAVATVAQIRARLTLAESSMARWDGLRQRDAVSQQEVDERRAALHQAQADLAAAQANVKRLQQLHDFGRVTAPFDGVVVRRQVDVGALVAAGSASTTAPLYHLAQTDGLRLTVAVPQAYAADVAVGKEVGVKLLERPNAPFKGKVTRVSGGIDVATRSVEVEVAVPNADGKLLPGAYVEVNLPLSSTARTLLLAPNALQFRQDGPQVAIVVDEKIQVRQLKLGRDLGRAVEVLAGLSPKDMVVLNPRDTLEVGERVSAKEAPPDKEAAQRPEPGGASRPSPASAPSVPPAPSRS